MLQTRNERRGLSFALRSAMALAVLVSGVLLSYSPALANFSSESTDQIIGVGRIQSSPVSTAEPSASGSGSARFVAPEPLTPESTEAVSQLAQPLERSTENVESAIVTADLVQRFGEPDAGGWFTTEASAYGPSSAGQWTALGTEVTLTSMDIACRIDQIDVLLGHYVEIMYNGTTLRCKVTDNGTLAPGRLFDFQPGVCTYFGAETPEFSWGLRTVQWRFAD